MSIALEHFDRFCERHPILGFIVWLYASAFILMLITGAISLIIIGLSHLNPMGIYE